MMQSSPLDLRRAVILAGRLILGGVFVYAGISKLVFPNSAHLWPWFMLKFSVSMNLASFAQQVESYKLLSTAASSLLAHTLPFAEIALGLLLFIGWRLRIWATLASLVTLTFLAVVTRAYLLHMDINCGCFGTPEKLTGMTVLRDSLFVLLALLMTIFAFLEGRQPHPWSAEASPMPEKL